MKNVGYKEMLRNRIPKSLDLTLLWCKTKTRWVDYVYLNMIRIFAERKDRDSTIRIILKNRTQIDPYGAHKSSFDFKGSINWFDLSKDEEEHWKYVSDWYDWFDHYYPHLKESLSYLRNMYKHETTLVEQISNKLQDFKMDELDEEWQQKLALFLVKNIK